MRAPIRDHAPAHRRARLAPLFAVLACVAATGPGCVTMFVQGSLEPDTHCFDGLERAWVIEGGEADEDRLVVRFDGYALRRASRFPFDACWWSEGEAEARFRLDRASGQAVFEAVSRTSAGEPPLAALDAPVVPPALAVPVLAASAPCAATAFVVVDEDGEARLFHDGAAFAIPRSHREAAPLQRAAQTVAFPVCVAADIALLPVYGIGLGVLWIAD